MHSLLPALVSGLFLGYGLYVLSSRGFNRISLSFLALCAVTASWQGVWAVLFQTPDPQLADRLIRAGYLVIIFLPTCLYHFVVEVLPVQGARPLATTLSSPPTALPASSQELIFSTMPTEPMRRRCRCLMRRMGFG